MIFIYRIIERDMVNDERMIVWERSFTKETAAEVTKSAMRVLNSYRNDRSKAQRYAYSLWEDIKEA
ncbi:MAG: hypothetical protein UHU21_06300 [Lachnospiraceae bacterium]|nr:hypothetical protein [Lachnospiraceae bacterium]